MEHLSAQHSHSLGMGLAVLSPGPPLLAGHVVISGYGQISDVYLERGAQGKNHGALR